MRVAYSKKFEMVSQAFFFYHGMYTKETQNPCRLKRRLKGIKQGDQNAKLGIAIGELRFLFKLDLKINYC